jgi:7-cyano-7-deazaguanine reductase
VPRPRTGIACPSASKRVGTPVAASVIAPTLPGYPGAITDQTLTKLGNPDAHADRRLETFETADTTLQVVLHCREFTCRCPITGQPDWAEITIAYRPKARIVESKSVKLYLETFREEGIFHEHLATTIRDDFVGALDPRSLDVTVMFSQRGGIAIDATSSYAAEG